MKAEYREQIDIKFKKKIETFVRKSAGAQFKADESSETDQIYTPCPFCDTDLIDTELSCHNCRNSIPFCIATGLHIVKHDLTVCPNCQFPAICSELLKILSFESICPMCNSTVDSSQVVLLDDIQSILYSDQQK